MLIAILISIGLVALTGWSIRGICKYSLGSFSSDGKSGGEQ